jgi:ribonuclease P protein component
MIQKKFRLKAEEIKIVLNKGKKIYSPYFSLYYLLNNLPYSRIGVIINRKISKLAVERNYMKRIIKLVFRNFFLKEKENKKNFKKLKEYDIVIVGKKRFLKKDFLKIENELISLFRKVNQ